MKNPSIDTIDKKIIGELIKDARIPVSQLAKIVRLSRQMVTRRIDKLCENGTIKCFTAQLNYEKLGMLHAEVWFTFRDFSANTREKIIDYFTKHPFTRWVGEVLSKYNMRATLIASNHIHLEVLLSEIFERWGTYIDDYELNIIVGVSKHHSTQLAQGEWGVLERMTEVEQRIDLDETDIRLLELVCEDARSTYSTLAKQVGLTLEAVRQRIKSLENKNVILHYSAKIQHKHLDRQWMILSVRFNNLNKEHKAAVAEFTRSKRFGANSYFLLGSWHYHITLNASSMPEIHQAVQEFYHTFSTHVRDVQPAQVIDSFKYPGYPKGMFGVLGKRQNN